MHGPATDTGTGTGRRRTEGRWLLRRRVDGKRYSGGVQDVMLFSYLLMAGITSGALYAMVAAGLVICYRTTGHINFSHGELFMVGGFLAFQFHVLWGMPYLISLALAVVGGAAVGLITDRVIYRSLIKSPPIAMVVATIAPSRWMANGSAPISSSGAGAS